jgi:hypothetical protein
VHEQGDVQEDHLAVALAVEEVPLLRWKEVVALGE